MKTWRKIVRLVVLLVVLIPVAATIAIQMPAVQTYVVGKVSDALTRDLDGSAHVGKVYFSFPNNLILKDVDIIQGASDTVVHAGKLLLNLKTTSLVLSDEARIRRVSLEDGRISIRKLDDSTTNLSLLLAPLTHKNKEKDPDKAGLPWNAVQLDRLTLKNVDFSLDSLAIQDINLTARKLRYAADGASGRIESLTLKKGDELEVRRFETDIAYDSTGVTLRGFRYDDGYSNIDADRLALGFTDFSDFSQFTDKVKIGAALHHSRIDLRTVKPFIDLGGRELALVVDGAVDGTVSNLRSDRLRITSDSGHTLLELNFKARGLPDLERSNIQAEIVRGETTTEDLSGILAGVLPGFNRASVARLAQGEPLSLTAHVDGSLANLQATGRLSTATMGEAGFNATLHKQGKTWQADGTASTASLQLGRILGIDQLGALSCHTDVNFSHSPHGMSVDLLPLSVDHFQFKGYDYHDITASGQFQDGVISADLSCDDPNLQLSGHGDIVLGGKGHDNQYQINLGIDHADLHALNFDHRDSSAVSLFLNTDIVQTADGDFLGTANIRSLTAYLPGQSFDIGDIALVSSHRDNRYNLTLDSDIARAEYEGNLFVADFATTAYHLLYQDNLEHLFGGKHAKSEDVISPGLTGSFDLLVRNLEPLTGFFLPSLFVAPQTSVRAELANNEVLCGLSSELVAYNKILLQNMDLRCLTEDELIRAYVDADLLQIAGMKASNLDVDAVADSLIDLRFAFHNEDGSGNSAHLHTLISFPDPETEEYPLRVDLLPSDLAIAGHPWTLTPAVVRYREKQIRIDNFSIRNGEQSLLANGVIGTAPADTVRLRLNDFDLGIANSFLTLPMDLHGQLTGEGEAFALLGPEKGILLDMKARDVSTRDIELGDFVLQSRWDDPARQFLFFVDNTLQGRHPLLANASLHPADKNLNLDVQLDSLAVGIVEPILSSLFTDMEGSLSGHLKASGPLDKLSVSSENARFNDFHFVLDYTKVPYVASGPVTINDSGVTFDNVALSDRFGHSGKLSGGIPYDHFKNIRLNVRIDLQDMMALNTTSHDNESFYGRAFADGTVRVGGTLDKIRLSLNLTPTGNSTIHIPVGNSAKTNQSLLTFINNEKKISLIDSMILARQTPGKTENTKTDISVNLRLNATPDAEIQLEVDKNTGDILKARGNGQIGISVTSDLFDIKGDYRVDSGSYHFGMLGFAARDFSIDPGGTITFGGDVMQSTLDMTATYHTKASISPLIADSTAVSTRRTVECRIGLTGKLANPEIKFNIDIPDLDPTTQSRVESALNTEDKRMKQTLALLISGGFVPDEQSGIVNSTTVLFSNASEMMSNQINNIFRQLDIPLDLGFNYQPTETGRDIFDVAVSTQLFNNRVSINGNIGNRQFISSSNSDIVGDLDIEIKLNRQGQVRLTLFSHSADQYSNYLDQSQRNGAGIVYQEDFNSFKDLWRKIFHIKSHEQPTLPDPNAPRPLRAE